VSSNGQQEGVEEVFTLGLQEARTQPDAEPGGGLAQPPGGWASTWLGPIPYLGSEDLPCGHELGEDDQFRALARGILRKDRSALEVGGYRAVLRFHLHRRDPEGPFHVSHSLTSLHAAPRSEATAHRGNIILPRVASAPRLPWPCANIDTLAKSRSPVLEHHK
jgi:hypothetical protein